MDKKERFNAAFEYLRYKGIVKSQKQIADAIGATPPHISSALKGDEKYLTDNLLIRFQSKYNFFNRDWLLYETGEMTNTDELNQEKPNNTCTKPRINVYANAGMLTEAIEDYSEQMPIIEQMPKYDFTILVKGDSMEPEFKSGEEVACLKVDGTGFIQWGKPHVMNTSQGVVLKRLYKGKHGYRCVSDNKIYPEFEIPEEEVYSISIVVGMLRTY